LHCFVEVSLYGCVWFPSPESEPASALLGPGWPSLQRASRLCLVVCTGRACMRRAAVWCLAV
jgi:hypothetical protein